MTGNKWTNGPSQVTTVAVNIKRDKVTRNLYYISNGSDASWKSGAHKLTYKVVHEAYDLRVRASCCLRKSHTKEPPISYMVLKIGYLGQVRFSRCQLELPSSHPVGQVKGFLSPKLTYFSIFCQNKPWDALRVIFIRENQNHLFFKIYTFRLEVVFIQLSEI